MGFIGFAVKLIHIPINNILVSFLFDGMALTLGGEDINLGDCISRLGDKVFTIIISECKANCTLHYSYEKLESYEQNNCQILWHQSALINL